MSARKTKQHKMDQKKKHLQGDQDTFTVILEFFSLLEIARLQILSKFVLAAGRRVIHTPLGNTLFVRVQRRTVQLADVRAWGRFVSQRRKYFPDQFYLEISTQKHGNRHYFASVTRAFGASGSGCIGRVNIYLARSFAKVVALLKACQYNPTDPHATLPTGHQCCFCDHEDVRDACCLIYFSTQ